MRLVLFALSASLAARDLETQIQKHIQRYKKTEKVGIKIIALDTSTVLYAKNDTALMVPASATKLTTSIAALNFLGPGYRFETTISTNGSIKKGILRGNICLTGSGDPSLTSHDIARCTRALKALGITQITGSIIVDASVFDAVWYAPGVKRVDTEWRSPVGATLPTAGITINHNYVNKTRRAVTNPVRYAGECLYYALRKQGIQVAHTILTKKVAYQKILVVHESPSLKELIQVVLKDSDNLYADCIFKALSARSSHGTWSGSAKRVTDFLENTVHLPKGYTLVDGSGLSRANKMTAHQFVLLLMWAYHNFVYFSELLDGLPQAGVDGTLKRRIHTPILLAKTGTLTGISSLVGYCLPDKQPACAFAILAHGPSSGTHKKGIEDGIARSLATHVQRPKKKRASNQ